MSAAPQRAKLVSNGFLPLPCEGKRPLLPGWQTLKVPTEEQIAKWSTRFPHCRNTGLLTRFTPGFDVDILNEPAAQAVEDLTTKWFGKRGSIIVRTGSWPKRLIPFRTNDPFRKIAVTFVEGGKLEILGDGQQFVAFGIHPDTHRPYEWENGESPLTVERSELPYINEAEARELVKAAVKLLIDHFGYRLPPKPRYTPLPTGPVNNNRYASSALERACAAIGGTANGDQESTLNRESFSIGQLVGAGIIDRATALNRITSAALSMVSYDSRRPWLRLDVVEKINRAFAQGLSKPRHPVRRAG
jgi:hypothetical protein